MRGSIAGLVTVALSLILASCARQTCPVDPYSGPGGKAAVPLGDGEGMWPLGSLALLDQERLRQKGLQMPIELLWAEGGGVAQAAIKLVNGCSASFVSPDGLIFTNHHCAYGAISRNSTAEHNWLAEGFVALCLHLSQLCLDGMEGGR